MTMPNQPSRRRALLLACGDYEDPSIPPLRSPQRDADELAAVLGDEMRGRYQVQKSVNCTTDQARVAIEQFLSEGQRSDLVLLYFSCHGILDSRNELQLAFRNTQQHLLQATGLSREWVHARLNESRAQSSIVLVDCCFSGSFVHGGVRARAAQRPVDVDGLVRDPPPGKARAILTASTATQLSFEDDLGRAAAAARPSYFTEAVITALRTGAADRDHDGRISVDDLYSFVYDRVVRSGHGQEPQRSIYGGGDLVVAFAEQHEPEPPLPPEPNNSDFQPQAATTRLAPWPPLPPHAPGDAHPLSLPEPIGLDLLLDPREVSKRTDLRRRRSVAAMLGLALAVVAILGVGVTGLRWTLSSGRRPAAVPSTTTSTSQTSSSKPSPTNGPTASPTTAAPTGRSTSTTSNLPTIPAGYRQVRGPGPITVVIPATWKVGPAKVAINAQGNDPADPDRFVRFGGSPAPNRTLLDVNLDNEKANSSIDPGYRRLQLKSVGYGSATAAVDWEFVFQRADGQQRHVLLRTWRVYGTDYVIYASAPSDGWSATKPILDTMLSYARPG